MRGVIGIIYDMTRKLGAVSLLAFDFFKLASLGCLATWVPLRVSMSGIVTTRMEAKLNACVDLPKSRFLALELAVDAPLHLSQEVNLQAPVTPRARAAATVTC